MRRFNGFSLMEMMVVLLIVAIVSAAAAPMVNKKILATAGEKSPWVFTGVGQDIAYDINNNSHAVIGGANPLNGAKLTIAQPDITPGTLIPHIAFNNTMGAQSNSLSIYVRDRNLAFSNNFPVNALGRPDVLQSTMFGNATNVTGNNATAVGQGAQAAQDSTALGQDAQATALNSTALGQETQAQGVRSVAVGQGTQAQGDRSVAVGQGAISVANNAISILGNAQADNAISIGANNNDNQGARAINSVAIGMQANVNQNATNSVAIGTQANVNQDAIALGSGALGTGESSIAIGQGARAVSTGSIQIGRNNNNPNFVNGGNSIGIGNFCMPVGYANIVIGQMAWTSENGAIAIGNNIVANGEGSIAIGSTIDTSEGGQGNGVSIGGASAVGDRAIAIGVLSRATAQNSVAIGSNVQATAQNSVAIGNNARATEVNTIVLGDSNTRVIIPGSLDVNGQARLGINSGLTQLRIRQSNNTDHQGWNCTLRANSSENANVVTASDRRLKNVGEAFTAGLEEIKKLEVFNYTFKKDESKTPRVGVMAQDLEKIFPKAVFKGEDGFLRIRMEDMFYALVNAVKQLDAKIEELKNNEILTLKNRLDDLEKANKELRKENEALEKRLDKLEKKLDKKLKD